MWSKGKQDGVPPQLTVRDQRRKKENSTGDDPNWNNEFNQQKTAHLPVTVINYKLWSRPWIYTDISRIEMIIADNSMWN